MSLAVGGGFEEIGRAQVEQLIGAGLVDGMSVVDLGCGSGRTAIQIARCLPGVQYLGLDVVPTLLAHARSVRRTIDSSGAWRWASLSPMRALTWSSHTLSSRISTTKSASHICGTLAGSFGPAAE